MAGPRPTRRALIAAPLALPFTAAPAASSPAAIRSEDHWVTKGGVRLYLYRKRRAKRARDPVVFLVHGSSFSGRGGFDLQVPGRPGYSVMDWLAARGFDVWTMDHENYGRSDKTDGLSGVDSGADDLAAAFPYVERITRRRALRVYAQSGGALRAGVHAMREPDRYDRLILDAFTHTGRDAPEIARRRREANRYRVERTRPAGPDAIRRIFARDDPSLFEPSVADALGRYEAALTDRTPNGTYVDMGTKLPMVDPARLLCPVMVTRAEADGNATTAELLAFFAALPSPDRQFVMMSHVAHVALLGTERMKLWESMDAFFRYPIAAGTRTHGS